MSDDDAEELTYADAGVDIDESEAATAALIGAAGAIVAMPMAGSEAVALVAAGVFGAISGLLGEFTQRIFYSHSGTHVDPPALAIAIAMFVVGALHLAGVIPNAGYLGL